MTSQNSLDQEYWQRRSDMMYYKYIDTLVKAFAYEAKSIIDVGSANTKCIEAFHWIPNKYTLDIENPYSSPKVTAIETDFLTFTPEDKFDFALCLQVLEHIPQVEDFARKLFEISDRVLISVPYMWPEGSEATHIHDPVNEDKLRQWTGREPSYSIVVEEPLRIPSKGISRRLVSYYGPEGKNINYKKANLNVKSLKEDTEHENLTENKSADLTENHNVDEQILKNLNKIKNDQEKYYKFIKFELEIFNLEDRLKRKKEENLKLENRIKLLSKEINRYKKGIHQEVKQQQQFLKEHKKIIQSTSWKVMSPMRSIGSFVKKATNKRDIQR